MGILERFRAFLASRTSRYRHAGQSSLYPVRSKAGPTVNHYGALTLAGYFACVRVFSSAFAQMPWKVMEVAAAGQGRNYTTRRHSIDHPADKLLRCRANPEMNASTFREMMSHWVMTWGNAYAEIERDASSRPVALWPIEPWRVIPKRQHPHETPLNDDSLFYQVTNYDSQPVFFDPGDLLHFRGIGDDMEGWSIVRLAANALGLASTQEGSMSSQMRQSSRPSGIMTPPGNATMPADMLKAAEKSFNEKMTGSDAHGRVWFANKGMQFNPLNIPNTDMQMIESRQFSNIEFCRFTGTPPHKVYEMDRATWNNVETLNTDYLVDTIGPWACKFEQEANTKLLARPRQYETRFDTSELTRADRKSRAEYFRTMFSVGAYSPNDIRNAEDMNPIKGGDQYFVQTSMAPLESFMEPPEPDPATVEPPQEVNGNGRFADIRRN